MKKILGFLVMSLLLAFTSNAQVSSKESCSCTMSVSQEIVSVPVEGLNGVHYVYESPSATTEGPKWHWYSACSQSESWTQTWGTSTAQAIKMNSFAVTDPVYTTRIEGDAENPVTMYCATVYYIP